MKSKLLVFLLAFMGLHCTDEAVMDLGPDDRVDAVIEEQMARLHIPGLAFALLDGGDVVEIGGLGVGNLDQTSSVTANTVFEIGSLTKPITATAVMMLVEEGKLSLTDRITDHVPDLPPSWDAVTVRHLLSHTSGIRSYTDGVDFLSLARTEYTQREILDMVIGYPLDFTPGTKWDYNNSGYYLLGMLIEAVSGQSYWEFLDDNIFEPLGMTATGPTDMEPLGSRGRAIGYSWDEAEDRWIPRNGITPSAGYAAGSLASSITDLASWIAALAGGELVEAATLQQMWTPVPLSGGRSAGYGFGWYLNTYEDMSVVEHSGGSPGFTGYVLHFPEEDVTVLVLANRWLLDSSSLARNLALLMRAVGTHHIRSHSSSDLELAQ